MATKGYLPHKVIKGFVFWILSLCLAAATLTGILYRWKVLDEEAANRCLWSAFILALGSLVFLFINVLFGDLSQRLLGQETSPPQTDSAFSDRLRRAKAGGKDLPDAPD